MTERIRTNFESSLKVVHTVRQAIENRRSRLDRGTHKPERLLPSRARRQTQLWQRCRRPLCRS